MFAAEIYLRFSVTQKNWILWFVFFIGFGIYAMTKGQELSYDFTDYHFYNGFAFLHNRLNRDYAVGEIQTYFNPLLDALNYSLIMHFNDPRLLRFLLGGIGGLNGFFLFKIASMLFTPSRNQSATLKIWLSVIIGMSGATVLSQIGSVMNDAQSALFIVMAVFFVLKAFAAEQNKTGYYVLAGVCLGLGMALKLTNAIYGIAMLLGMFAYIACERKAWRSIGYLLLGFMASVVVFEGWWAWRVYQEFGNPIFPYYNSIFHSPYFLETSSNDNRFGIHSLGGALYLPFILMHRNSMVVSEPVMRDARLAAFFLLTALFMVKYIYWRSLKKTIAVCPPWIFIFTFTFAAYFLWAFQFGIYRYAIPFALMLGPCIVVLIEQIWQGWRISKLLLWIITLALLATTMRPDFGHKQQYDAAFLTVNAPSIPSGSMVIVAAPGEAFILPFLNPEAQFVNADFPNIQADVRAQDWIKAHQGPLYILINPDQAFTLAHVAQFYAFYQFEPGPCETIETNMTHFNYRLCPLFPIHQSKVSQDDAQ